MKRLRNSCTGRRPVHFFRKLGGLAAGLTLAAAPLSFVMPAPAAAAAAAAAKAPRSSGFSIADFYASRRDALLWLAPTSGSAAQDLVALLDLLREVNVSANAILELWVPQQATLEETIKMEHAWAEESVAYLRRYIRC